MRVLMSNSLAHRLDPLPRKSPARAALRGEGARKFLADVHLGSVIERAIALAGMTKDQAARAMGYESASSVSRWIANEEPVNFSRLWAAPELRSGLVAALAENAGDAVEVQTTVIVRRWTA